MKKRPIKTKLLTALLTLCMVLSLAPISAFAESGAYAVKFYPGDYGTMTKNDQIPFVYYGFDDDVNKPYYYKLNVSETETLSFASSIINVLLPNSGYEFAYWTADATVYQVGSDTAISAGTALSSDQLQNKITVKSDVTFTAHFKQISENPDDSVITSAAIENAKFTYQPGDAPQATAEVYNADADKYEIAYECWQQFENNEPVAAWYSDNGSHGSLPTITKFESGKKYVYFVMLKQKDGYSFSSETAVTVNGESVKSSLSGEFLYVPAVKTITPTQQTSAITSVDIENVKLDYQPGSAPQASAKRGGADQGYDISYECWEKREKDANDTVSTVAYWYSDENCYSDGNVQINTFEKGGRYRYSVKLQAKDGYTFDSNLTNRENVTLNGASLPSGSWVMVMDDGKTCLIQYGTELRPGQAVEKIDFNARINFNAGDKPSFMTSAVNPFIDLDHERWDANDGSGYGITSSDYWNERYNGKLITEFEAGKSYTYGVYFKISDLGMEEGYRFDKNTKLYINGKEITLTPDQIDVDDNGETIWFSNVLTMTPMTVKVIDVVEINDVTVSFKDGDKPVFTGKVPDGANYAYRCEWWELNSTTGAMSTDFGNFYENKITAFEAGKTYHYGVYVTTYGDVDNVRYVFGPDTKLKINGEFVNYKRYEGDTSDGSDGTMWVLTDLTMTPETGGTTPAEKYTVTYTDGRGGIWFANEVYSNLESGTQTPAYNNGVEPTRDGYIFKGWLPEVAETVTENVTYVAQWESKSELLVKELLSDIKVECVNDSSHAKEYDTSIGGYSAITLEGENGKFTSTITVDAKRYIERYNDDTGKTHQLVAGEAETQTIVVEFDSSYSKDSVTVKSGTLPVTFKVTCAQQPDQKYTVTYTDGVDGEEIFKDQIYTVESGKATPAFSGTPTRDGYKFTGWSPKVAETVTGNVTYTAQWEKQTPAETFTVTYTDGVDGEEIFKNQTYTVESGKATPAFNGTPTRKGYTFTGWKPAVAATVTGNATYEATWKVNSTTPSENKPNTGETTSPKTGDTSNVVLWAALLFVSCGALAGTVVIGKKKKTMK